MNIINTIFGTQLAFLIVGIFLITSDILQYFNNSNELQSELVHFYTITLQSIGSSVMISNQIKLFFQIYFSVWSILQQIKINTSASINGAVFLAVFIFQNILVIIIQEQELKTFWQEKFERIKINTDTIHDLRNQFQSQVDLNSEQMFERYDKNLNRSNIIDQNTNLSNEGFSKINLSNNYNSSQKNKNTLIIDEKSIRKMSSAEYDNYDITNENEDKNIIIQLKELRSLIHLDLNLLYHINLVYEYEQVMKSKYQMIESLIRKINRYLKTIFMNKQIKVDFYVYSKEKFVFVDREILIYLMKFLCKENIDNKIKNFTLRVEQFKSDYKSNNNDEDFNDEFLNLKIQMTRPKHNGIKLLYINTIKFLIGQIGKDAQSSIFMLNNEIVIDILYKNPTINSKNLKNSQFKSDSLEVQDQNNNIDNQNEIKYDFSVHIDLNNNNTIIDNEYDMETNQEHQKILIQNNKLSQEFNNQMSSKSYKLNTFDIKHNEDVFEINKQKSENIDFVEIKKSDKYSNEMNIDVIDQTLIIKDFRNINKNQNISKNESIIKKEDINQNIDTIKKDENNINEKTYNNNEDVPVENINFLKGKFSSNKKIIQINTQKPKMDYEINKLDSKILLLLNLDDESNMLKMHKRLFSKHNFHLNCKRTSAEYFDLLAQIHFDQTYLDVQNSFIPLNPNDLSHPDNKNCALELVILMDHMLDGEYGHEIILKTQQINLQYQFTIKQILLSSTEDRDTMEKQRDLNVNEQVVKPLNKTKIVDIIQRITECSDGNKDADPQFMF